MTKEEKIAILKDIIDGEIINPQVRSNVGIWAIKALEQSSYNSIKTELKPCEDAISRKLVKAEYKRRLELSLKDESRGLDLTHLADCTRFNEFIDSIPSVNPQPKTGHWKHNKCDVCGASRPPLFDNYCPNCGAKMVEPQERSCEG